MNVVPSSVKRSERRDRWKNKEDKGGREGGGEAGQGHNGQSVVKELLKAIRKEEKQGKHNADKVRKPLRC